MGYELFILAVIVTIAFAQSPDLTSLSPCITSCGTNAAITSGCSDVSNIPCLCSSSSFQSNAVACLEVSCSANDQDLAVAAFQKVCANLGGSASGSSSKSVSSSASVSQSNGTGASNANLPSTSSTIGRTDTTTMPTHSSHSATGTIVGITIGVLALALLLVGWIVIRRRRNRPAHQSAVQGPGHENKGVSQGPSARDIQYQVTPYPAYGIGGLPRNAPGLEDASSTVAQTTTASTAGTGKRVLSAEEAQGRGQHDRRTDAAPTQSTRSISGDNEIHVAGSSEVFPLDMLMPEQRMLIQSMRQLGTPSDSIAAVFARMLAANEQPQAQSGSGPTMPAADSPPQYDFKYQRGGGS
ncbi:hypothetical protein BKA62DRAFT_833654 [Auriculariales sp. MPI-PUGE-AT-0066]|nr:hypothetical protein BKA62DRAFT_833654 [Auriculariales sp. MPI-PUGE-AT-0066]